MISLVFLFSFNEIKFVVKICMKKRNGAKHRRTQEEVQHIITGCLRPGFCLRRSKHLNQIEELYVCQSLWWNQAIWWIMSKVIKKDPKLKLLSQQELALQSLKKPFLQWALKGIVLSINHLLRIIFRNFPWGQVLLSQSSVKFFCLLCEDRKFVQKMLVQNISGLLFCYLS